MMDGLTNPFEPAQIDKNGEGYKTGIFIHGTNQDGWAYSSVSIGCLLIEAKDFKKFNEIMSGVKNFTVQVSRKQLVFEKKFKFFNLPNVILKRD